MEDEEKLHELKKLIQEGLDDVKAGRVSEWNYEKFLREARLLKPADK